MVKLAPPEICTGCGLCAAVCPFGALEMALDENGFFMPRRNEDKCTGCGACEKSCPALKNAPFESGGHRAYAAWIKDGNKRFKSTSGGIFTALCKKIIDDGGYVFGAVFDENLNLLTVPSDTLEGCFAMQGSKYIQSDASASFMQVKKLLSENKEVLYTGTPCQIAALKSLSGQNDKLYTCEVLCHGVGSNGYFNDIIKDKESAQGKKVVGVKFREKSKGCAYSNFSITFSDGKTLRAPSYYSTFGYPFSKSVITRLSCLECRYSSVSRCADITLGDYSGRDKSDYSDTEIKNGISSLFVNTTRGEELIESIADTLVLDEKDFKYLSESCLAMRERHTDAAAHNEFFALYGKSGYEAVRDRFGTAPKNEVFRFRHQKLVQGSYNVLKKFKLK